MVRHTRRRLLLAGGATLALTGCGAEPPPDASDPGESETGRRADAEVLNAALEVKLLALGKYGEEAPASLRAAERAHARRLEEEIRRLGGTPVDRVTDTAEGGPAAIAEREEWSVAAIQDLLPKVSDRELRSLLARMMVVDSEQLATVRRELGSEPAPDALLAPQGPG